MIKEIFSVLVCEPMAPEGLALLRDQPHLRVDVRLGLARENLMDAIGDYDAILVRSQTKLDEAMIARAGKLKLIGRAGVGIDNIDIEAAKNSNIAVINTPLGNSISAAELAFALILSAARNIPEAHAHVRSGKWERKQFQGCELYNKTLGILGFGNVGQNLAQRAAAFSMKVIAHDPWIHRQAFDAQGATSVSFDDVLAQADFLSLHCGLSEQTKNIINHENIKKMRRGAMLINTARGELIDDQALIEALDSGHLSRAALDVFGKEPPLTEDPLLKHPKIILTPHLGASTEEAQQRVSTLLAEQTIAYFAGEKNLTRVV